MDMKNEYRAEVEVEVEFEIYNTRINRMVI